MSPWLHDVHVAMRRRMRMMWWVGCCCPVVVQLVLEPVVAQAVEARFP